MCATPASSQKLPRIGLGTFRLQGEAVQNAVRDALRLGYRHIDTASIYHNESAIGSVLQELYAAPSSLLTRSDVYLTSKLSPYDMATPHVALLKSLAALQTTYLDLYLIHWPGVARTRASSPENKKMRVEAWKVLNEAKREGLVVNIGVSNFTAHQLREVVLETGFAMQGAVVQMEVHPWYWRDALEIQSLFAGESVDIVGYALLAEGNLLGRDCAEHLDRIAEKHGISRVQTVLAWALKKGWGVLVRSMDQEHLRQNLEAFALVDVLTSEDCAVIDSISSLDTEEKFCWDPRHVA
ncbi:putative aldo-keto reductase [Calycina marina]|uniref:Aldo-keto reductase n=1 Tax=Calycina marina TaxID=1763456 RepID=A0A9P8CH08_9HELO|nr:putative aldo-keto reductase [Calycina marina]